MSVRRMVIKFFGLPMLTLLSFAIPAAAEKPDDDLDAMLAMMAGTYRTNPADLVGEEMPELLDRHVRVDAPRSARTFSIGS